MDANADPTMLTDRRSQATDGAGDARGGGVRRAAALPRRAGRAEGGAGAGRAGQAAGLGLWGAGAA